MSGCWGHSPAGTPHAAARGHEGSTLLQGGGSQGGAGHKGKAAARLSAGYGCLLSTWPGNGSSSTALEGDHAVMGSRERAVPGSGGLAGMWQASEQSHKQWRGSRGAAGRPWLCCEPPGQRHGLRVAASGEVTQHVQRELEGPWSLTDFNSKILAPLSYTKALLLADTDECKEFPFVCPRDKPVCVNTYGGYRCRSNKRCSRGFEPNEDGTACVGE